MKILNFGSLNVDHVYSVDHFVMPGETEASKSLMLNCGGKGLNQSIALARAGAKVFHAGKIGSDGSMLRERLAADNVDLSYLSVAPCPTGHAIIEVDKNGQNRIILFGGANTAIGRDDVDTVLSGFKKGDLILLQNEISCLPYIMERAHEKGMNIALNPSPMTDELAAMPELGYVRWFIMNEVEGQALTGHSDWRDIIAEMSRKFPKSEVVLTLGKDGAIYSDGHTSEKHGIYDVPVVDTTAAGDTFTGYFLAAISSGESAKKAIELASRASSMAVGRKGAADSIPTFDEVIGANLKLLD